MDHSARNNQEHAFKPHKYGSTTSEDVLEEYKNENEICKSYLENDDEFLAKEEISAADRRYMRSPGQHIDDKQKSLCTAEKNSGQVMEYEHELFQTPTSRHYVAHPSNNNISELRKTLASERLVREHSMRNISQSWSSPRCGP